MSFIDHNVDRFVELLKMQRCKKQKTCSGICKICKFYKPDKDLAGRAEAYGICRRFPPVPTHINKPLDCTGVFPLVSETQWCGEFDNL